MTSIDENIVKPIKLTEPAFPLDPNEKEIVRVKKPVMAAQAENHAYGSDGTYFGVVVANAEQLIEMGLTAGDPPPVDMDALKSVAMAQVTERHAEMLGKLTGGYSPEERDTWTVQLEWARGYLADQNPEHGTLLSGMVPTDIATTFADDAQMMAEKINLKAAAYARLTMIAARTKNQALAAIAAATTPDDLAATMTALVDVETAAIAELNGETP